MQLTNGNKLRPIVEGSWSAIYIAIGTPTKHIRPTVHSLLYSLHVLMHAQSGDVKNMTYRWITDMQFTSMHARHGAI